MMRLFFTLVLCASSGFLFAVNYTGVYSFNKGMNKANGTIYMNQFSGDTAFFIIEAVSGMPDFLMTDEKGFIRIDNGMATFIGKDSCNMEFILTSNSCMLREIGGCRHEFSTNGKYKKTSTQLKKGSSLLPVISDKTGFISKDSVHCYSAPHKSASTPKLLFKNEPIQITDEYNGYYLVEVHDKKNEFLWVSKKNIQISKF